MTRRAFPFFLSLSVVGLFSCSDPTGSEKDFSVPQNVAAQVLADSLLTLTWEGEFESRDQIIVARKAGENSWQNVYAIATAHNRQFTDNQISINSDTVFAYRLRLIRDTDTSAFSAAVAYFSEKCQPAGVFLKQTESAGLRVTWRDNSVGENGFRIDRKVGTNAWETGYGLCDSNTAEFYDSGSPATSAVTYRIAAYSGSSFSSAGTGSLTLASLFFGTAETFDVMTWNLLSFPRYDTITVGAVSQTIKAMNLDVVGLQEIASETGFQQLLDSLGWNGYRANSAAYDIDLAFIYNPVSVTVDQIYEIFRHENAFPRPPLVIELTWNSIPFVVIDNHYKAYSDEESQSRRLAASDSLEKFISTNFPDANVIVMGDLNDLLTDAQSVNVFWPFLSRSDSYQFADYGIATGSSTFFSYPKYASHLDHILITNELFTAIANPASAINTILVDNYLSGGWNEYDVKISDHRPVALKLAF